MKANPKFNDVNKEIRASNSLVEYKKHGSLSSLIVVNSAGRFTVTYKGRKFRNSYSIELEEKPNGHTEHHRVANLDSFIPLQVAIIALINSDVRSICSIDSITKSKQEGLEVVLPRTANESEMDTCVMTLNQAVRSNAVGSLVFAKVGDNVEFRLWSPVGKLTVTVEIKHGFIYNIVGEVFGASCTARSQTLHNIKELISRMVFTKPALFESYETVRSVKRAHRLNIMMPI